MFTHKVTIITASWGSSVRKLYSFKNKPRSISKEYLSVTSVVVSITVLPFQMLEKFMFGEDEWVYDSVELKVNYLKARGHLYNIEVN